MPGPPDEVLPEANSLSGCPQYLGADSFDCRPERYEIVVYYLLSPIGLIV